MMNREIHEETAASVHLLKLVVKRIKTTLHQKEADQARNKFA